MLAFYPLPNRTPDDVFNNNNFEANTVLTVRRQSSNNRVDWRIGTHSIYASAGISYATITTPRPFGVTPFNGAAGIRSDNNPYFQVGDAVVLTQSLRLLSPYTEPDESSGGLPPPVAYTGANST